MWNLLVIADICSNIGVVTYNADSFDGCEEFYDALKYNTNCEYKV